MIPSGGDNLGLLGLVRDARRTYSSGNIPSDGGDVWPRLTVTHRSAGLPRFSEMFMPHLLKQKSLTASCGLGIASGGRIQPQARLAGPVSRMNRPPRRPSRSFFSAGFRQGRRPALKHGRIEGSVFQKPIDFSGETANQRSLPGSQQLPPRRSSAGWRTRRRPDFSRASLTTIVYVRTLFADIALLCLGGSHGQRLTARPRDRSPQYRGTDPSR